MFKTFQEIAVYIHRFHNLDLFQQGWYQIKVSTRWEDGGYYSLGTPARVVQYEGSDDIYGVWRIDDKDNTFSTQPFRIKYARQDVHLSILISFCLYPDKCESPPTSAVILKFELMYAPTMEIGSELQAALDAGPAAVHEFRIPPKALLGVHSYCPVHFDMLHAVLIDVSVHVSLLAAGSQTPALKVSSNSSNDEGVAHESIGGSNKVLNKVASVNLNPRMLVKTLLDSRNTLRGDLEELGEAVNQAIDIPELSFRMNGIELFSSVLKENLGTEDDEISRQGKPQIGLEKANGSLDSQLNAFLNPLSEDDLLKIFNVLGHQVFYFWSTFLSFHSRYGAFGAVDMMW